MLQHVKNASGFLVFYSEGLFLSCKSNEEIPKGRVHRFKQRKIKTSTQLNKTVMEEK